MSLRDFGVLSDGRSVQEVTLGNGRLTAQFLTFGARINGLSFDEIDDLTPTLDLEAAEGSNPYSGVIVGPVMNRLGGARAPLNGQVLTFDANEGRTFSIRAPQAFIAWFGISQTCQKQR